MNTALTFRKRLFCICWPGKAWHPYRTTLLCNSDPISISADASNSETHPNKHIVRDPLTKSSPTIKTRIVIEQATTYRLLSVEIPWGRGHILRDVRVNLVSILVDFGRGQPRLTRLLKLELLPVVLTRLERYCHNAKITTIR